MNIFEIAAAKTDLADQEQTLRFTRHLLKRASAYELRQKGRYLWFRTSQTKMSELIDLESYSGRYCVEPKKFLANEYVNIARQVHDEGKNIIEIGFCLSCQRIRGYALDRDLDQLGLQDIQGTEVCQECNRFVFKPDEFHQKLLDKILEQYVLLEKIPDASEIIEIKEDEQILNSISGTECQQELIRRRWREQLHAVYSGALAPLDLELEIGVLEKRIQKTKAVVARAAGGLRDRCFPEN